MTIKLIRNLELLIPKDTIIFHNNGRDDIRCCTYTGNNNKLLYNGKFAKVYFVTRIKD